MFLQTALGKYSGKKIQLCKWSHCQAQVGKVHQLSVRVYYYHNYYSRQLLVKKPELPLVGERIKIVKRDLGRCIYQKLKQTLFDDQKQ